MTMKSLGFLHRPFSMLKYYYNWNRIKCKMFIDFYLTNFRNCSQFFSFSTTPSWRKYFHKTPQPPYFPLLRTFQKKTFHKFFFRLPLKIFLFSFLLSKIFFNFSLFLLDFFFFNFLIPFEKFLLHWPFKRDLALLVGKEKRADFSTLLLSSLESSLLESFPLFA